MGKNSKGEIKENFLNSKYDEKQKKEGSVSALPIMEAAELRCLNKLLVIIKVWNFILSQGASSMEKREAQLQKKLKMHFFLKVFIERNAKMISVQHLMTTHIRNRFSVN